MTKPYLPLIRYRRNRYTAGIDGIGGDVRPAEATASPFDLARLNVVHAFEFTARML